MTPGLADELAALDADFPQWHAWLSTRDPGEPGPVSVCATRCRPTHPCKPGCKNPDHCVTDGRARGHDPGSGETLDAPTPAHMRAKLTARAAS